MICRKCGKEIPQGGRYCKYCGFDEGGTPQAQTEVLRENTAQDNTSGAESKPKPEKKPIEKKYLYYLIGALAVVAIIIGAFSLGKKSNKDVPEEEVVSEVKDNEEKPEKKPEPTENKKKEDTPAEEAATENVDEIFLSYLQGKIKSSDGSTFEANEENEAEFALLDMNDDGQNEMVIRSYGYFIPDVLVYKDGKITAAGVDNAGSAGITFINTKNQYVSGDTTHVDREQYFVSDIDKNGEAKTSLFFAKYWGEWAESGKEEFYKKENPKEQDYYDSNFDKISEEEFETLVKEYAQENTSLNWKRVDEIGKADSDNDSGSSAASGDVEKALKAYDDYMRDNYNSDYGEVKIALAYINDDDIPEAVIEEDGDISWCIIGYDKGKAVFMGGCVCDSLYYVPKGNRFYYDWCDGESTGFVCYTTKGADVSTWTIDEIYTTQGIEYHYSDGKGQNTTLSESEAQKYYSEAAKDSVLFEGKFCSSAEEAYKTLGNTPISDSSNTERELSVKSVSATSELKAQSVDGMTYSPKNVCDGDFSTPWVEGVDGVGKGEQITIKLDSPHEITTLSLYNGILKTQRRCMINGQVKKIEIDWGNGNKQIVDTEIASFPETDDAIRISDLRPTIVQPDKSCTTDTITITILEAVRGSKYEDTGISEIKIMGY